MKAVTLKAPGGLDKFVLGDVLVARNLLEKAFELGKDVRHPVAKVGELVKIKSLKELALDDPDLESLWFG